MERKKRKVLVIMSNRLDRTQKVRYFELECDDEGNILEQKTLRGEPREARFAEVWENDDGKTDIDSCRSFKRKYRHRLEQRP
jgi:hypothetical protein